VIIIDRLLIGLQSTETYLGATMPTREVINEKTKKFRESRELPLARIQLLSDIIYAMAMIFLVFNIPLPGPEATESYAAALLYFQDVLPEMAAGIITFVLIAVYWMKNVQHFLYFDRLTVPFAWLHILHLAFVATLPMTNKMTIVLNEIPGALVLYSINIGLVGVFSFFAFRYAVKNKLTIPGVEEEELRKVQSQALIEPTVAIIAIPAALFSPLAWDAVFVAIPLIHGWLSKQEEVSLKKKLADEPDRV
jgi:uncharacterized membrane protein